MTVFQKRQHFFRDSILRFFSNLTVFFPHNGMLSFFFARPRKIPSRVLHAFCKIPSSGMLCCVRFGVFELDPNGMLGLTVFLMVLTVFLMFLTVSLEIPSLGKMLTKIIENGHFHDHNTVILNLFLIKARMYARFDSILGMPSNDLKCRLLLKIDCHLH